MKIAALFLLLLLAIPAGAVEIQSYAQMQVTPPSADDGETLIDFKNDEPDAAIDALLKNSQYSWFSHEENWIRVKNASRDLISKIQSTGEVEEIEPNYYMTALFVPNDPYYKYQWHLDLVGMQKAWDFPRGAQVIVAVIDTGIAYEDYQDKFKVEDFDSSQFVDPYNFIDGTTHAGDDHGHGTHVAGTIAQLTNNGIGVAGIAPNVKLMPLKVLSSSGYGTVADVAAAIRYAADHHASVINMSLGGAFPSFILHKAVRYAHDKGVTIVCAAGNSGSAGIDYPAKYSECISVSAVRFDRQITWYSSYGKNLTIAAPGGDMNVDQNGDGLMDGILQNTLNPQDPTKQGYFLFQGTSMATPHVAAAAALLISHGVTDPDRVREILTETASPVKGGSPDQYGAGVLDIDAALQAAYSKRDHRLIVAACLLLFLFAIIFNRGKSKLQHFSIGPVAIIGLLIGSTGFFFFGRLPYVSQIFFLTHPVAEWQLPLFGTAGQGSVLFFSVLPAMIVAFFAYPWKRLAGFSTAFALGMAAFLLFQAISPLSGISFVPGRFLETVWLLVQSFFCIAVAAISAIRVRSLS